MINSKTVLRKGIFVLSLDTELCWGVVDKPNQIIKNKKYYEQARACIQDILKLLEKYHISATWAIVGHLFQKDCYKNADLWYGQDIIKNIMNSGVYQEIACHSFAHIPFSNKKTKRHTVQVDLKNCVSEAQKLELELKSFVFPRNTIGYIDELSNFGFVSYRGEEPTWYRKFPKKIRKVCHILDQFFAVSPPVSLPIFEHGLYNIPGSMFYLPMNGFRGCIPLKFRIYKAKKGIRKAIEQKKIFHLWFHPFNIATNKEKLLFGLEEILKEVYASRKSGVLETKSMNEIGDVMCLNAMYKQ